MTPPRYVDLHNTFTVLYDSLWKIYFSLPWPFLRYFQWKTFILVAKSSMDYKAYKLLFMLINTSYCVTKYMHIESKTSLYKKATSHLPSTMTLIVRVAVPNWFSSVSTYSPESNLSALSIKYCVWFLTVTGLMRWASRTSPPLNCRVTVGCGWAVNGISTVDELPAFKVRVSQNFSSSKNLGAAKSKNNVYIFNYLH